VIALLDVNVLLALFWRRHVFHENVKKWFIANRAAGWATCPMTEAGFIRLYAQPSLMGVELHLADACELIERNTSSPEHTFWPQTHPVSQMTPALRSRLTGHQQLTDAILLDLAIRNGGKLVTLDKRIARLLHENSPHRDALESIPVE
jgi:toxin-antitoxin system PIN domain toxin